MSNEKLRASLIKNQHPWDCFSSFHRPKLSDSKSAFVYYIDQDNANRVHPESGLTTEQNF